MLNNIAEDPSFIKRTIIGNETWVYEYGSKNAPKPKKTRQSRWKIKVMLIVFSITVLCFTMNSVQSPGQIWSDTSKLKF